MALHDGETFSDQTVALDGNDYRNCTFTNCEIIFNGTAGVSLHGISFNDCRWTFDGPAGLTINFMTALYQAGVTDLIDQTFANIRRGSFLQSDTPPTGSRFLPYMRYFHNTPD